MNGVNDQLSRWFVRLHWATLSNCTYADGASLDLDHVSGCPGRPVLRRGSTRALADHHLLLDDVTLDATDEEGAVGVQGLHLRRLRGGLERGLVVEPQLGDAVDLDIGGRDVGAGAF